MSLAVPLADRDIPAVVGCLARGHRPGVGRWFERLGCDRLALGAGLTG
jgi:hypothetical protein